jgi:hypothetical protein
MSSRVTSELGPRQIPELPSSEVRATASLRFRALRMSVTPLLHRIKIPELHTFANSGLHRFQASENREFPAPEKHVSRTLSNLTFRGWRVFLNSPTLAPRGSGLTPTIRFHESFGNLVKKTSPSERRRGHASPGNPRTVRSRQVSRNYPPPAL